MTDREMDALVAEKVMGHKYEEKCLCDFPWCGSCAGYKAYSTDIAAAWEVVEKMRGVPGNSWWLSLHQISQVHPIWVAAFTFGGQSAGMAKRFDGKDESSPRAICLAALKAVGVEVPS